MEEDGKRVDGADKTGMKGRVLEKSEGERLNKKTETERGTKVGARE